MKIKKFKDLISSKHLTHQQIGVSYSDLLICCCIRESQKIQTIWQKLSLTDDALVRIDDIIKQAVSSDEKFTIVYPIPADYIWQKILYFPSYLNPQQQYKQAIQILKQELPIPLTEVYFDIQSSLDTKSNRIKTTIYVLKKSYGEPFLGKSNVILDNELFCYVRGIAALNETDQEHLSELQNKDIEQLSFPENILDKKLYLIALGASLWNGKVSI